MNQLTKQGQAIILIEMFFIPQSFRYVWSTGTSHATLMMSSVKKFRDPPLSSHKSVDLTVPPFDLLFSAAKLPRNYPYYNSVCAITLVL